MKIQQLIDALPFDAQIYGNMDLQRDIDGIVYDSRQAGENVLFCAIPGQQTDGHDYVQQAIDKGAIAVLLERRMELPAHVSGLLVPNSRQAMSYICSAFFACPDQKLRLIGVTGTNGKTTTTNLIKYLLEQAGHKSGLLGTVGGMAGSELLPEHISASTTPESLELFRLLALMTDKNCDYAVIEASSHALEQGRVAACHFAGAVFTNLTQDHLDYHLTMDNYCASKCKLFSMLDKSAYGVVNLDDPYAQRFLQACAVPQWTYGEADGATLQLIAYSASISGMHFQIKYQDKLYAVEIPLIGKFNIYNALAAMCVALAEGLAIDDIVSWMKQAPQVAGRFELIQEGQDFAVVVDYAHTPDGLSNVLAAARQLHPQQIITVFGCGGDRDNTKRPIMGRIAGQMSDMSILTSDNPRTENPLRILDMVEEGIRQVSNNYLVKEDRGEAIRIALEMAHPGDMVVLAGKGHEDYQVIGTEKVHFDDREIARTILRARLKK